jgi:hypothetical protein
MPTTKVFAQLQHQELTTSAVNKKRTDCVYLATMAFTSTQNPIDASYKI